MNGSPAPAWIVRAATPPDLPGIQSIYADHVRHGTATFELDPPDLAEMTSRFVSLREGGFPYLVATDADGRVIGYGYAGPYRARPAYRFTVEDSIYLAPEHCGKGIGRLLLERLLAESAEAGFRQMVAVIGDSVNIASIRVHRAAGFAHVGTFRNVGYKFNRWLDTVMMQRELTPPGS